MSGVTLPDDAPEDDLGSPLGEDLGALAESVLGFDPVEDDRLEDEDDLDDHHDAPDTLDEEPVDPLSAAPAVTTTGQMLAVDALENLPRRVDAGVDLDVAAGEVVADGPPLAAASTPPAPVAPPTAGQKSRRKGSTSKATSTPAHATAAPTGATSLRPGPRRGAATPPARSAAVTQSSQPIVPTRSLRAPRAAATAAPVEPTAEEAAALAAEEAAFAAAPAVPGTPVAGTTAERKARTQVILAELIALDPADEVTGDRLRAELIELHRPLAEYLARRFANRGEPLDDLIQVASIGLIKAVDRFDPTRGAQFSTFAAPTIMGELRRHFRDTAWSVHVPRGLQELRAQVSQASDYLAHELGRSPTARDIAAHLKVSVDDVYEALEVAEAYSSVPIDAPRGGEGNYALSDVIGGVDPRMGLVEDRNVLGPLLAQLPERERTILTLRFVDELSQSEIAKRVGVSQMHVSRLLTKTLKLLRSQLDEGQ